MRSTEYKCCYLEATIGLKFFWINQLTWIFYHNERAVLFWLSQLSGLNFGPKQGPLFSPHSTDCTLLTLSRKGWGALYWLLIIIMILLWFYSIQEYSSWLMSRIFFCTACIACWFSWEGCLGSAGGPTPMTYPLIIFHQLENVFTVYIVVVHYSVYHTQSTQWYCDKT